MFLLRLEIALPYKLLFQMFSFMNLLDRIFLWPIIGTFSLFFVYQDFFKPSFTFPGFLPWEVFLQDLCWWLYMACQWCFQFFAITVTFQSCLDSLFQSKADMAWVRDTLTCTNPWLHTNPYPIPSLQNLKQCSQFPITPNLCCLIPLEHQRE